jgi:hypothetical protein
MADADFICYELSDAPVIGIHPHWASRRRALIAVPDAITGWHHSHLLRSSHPSLQATVASTSWWHFLECTTESPPATAREPTADTFKM